MSRRCLLIVTTSFPERRDGSEAAGAFVADVAAELATRMSVRVVAPGAHSGVEELDGIRIHRFASPGRPLSLLSPTRPQDWPAIVAVLRSLRAQTLAAAADGEVAHTLAMWALPSGWAASVLAGKRGVPYSVWALGSDIWSLGRIPLVRGILRRVLRGARGRFADGLELSRDAGTIAGLPFEFLPSTRRTLAVGSRELPDQPPYRLLFLGRWHPNKGIDLLLGALLRLGPADWARIGEFRIAGGGPLAPLVQERVAALVAAGRPVVLDGFLDATAAATAMAAADWLVIPSRIESIPVVFSDALKAGRPVIATPVGDLPELLSTAPPCGVLAAAASAEAIADAIASALAMAPAQLLPGVRRAAATFDLAAIADRIVAAVRE